MSLEEFPPGLPINNIHSVDDVNINNNTDVMDLLESNLITKNTTLISLQETINKLKSTTHIMGKYSNQLKLGFIIIIIFECSILGILLYKNFSFKF